MLEKKGVDFYFSTPMKKIIRENGKVTGAVAYEKDGTEVTIRCKALIVASGGISGNMEMMKELGVIHTKFEDAYKDGGQVMITFPDSCQDGDGQKAVWEGDWWKEDRNRNQCGSPGAQSRCPCGSKHSMAVCKSDKDCYRATLPSGK